MKMISLLYCLFTCISLAYSGPLTGVYSYSKGVNKAGATIYLNHFKDDSAFIYMTAISGAPDFLTTELKCFIRIQGQEARYQSKDSCGIQFYFSPSQVELVQHASCPFEYPTDGKYKKTGPQLKKGSMLMLSYTEKIARVAMDSIWALDAPHSEAKAVIQLKKDMDVTITDEYRGYYLIELKSHKTEFLWVHKKHLVLPKKP